MAYKIIGINMFKKRKVAEFYQINTFHLKKKERNKEIEILEGRKLSDREVGLYKWV